MEPSSARWRQLKIGWVAMYIFFSLPIWDSSFQHSLSFYRPFHKCYFLSTKPGQLLTNPARLNLFCWPWQDPSVASCSSSVCMLFHSGKNPADIHTKAYCQKEKDRQERQGDASFQSADWFFSRLPLLPSARGLVLFGVLFVCLFFFNRCKILIHVDLLPPRALFSLSEK